jgi:hypothetical protein
MLNCSNGHQTKKKAKNMADNYTQFSTAISLPTEAAYNYAVAVKAKLDAGEQPDNYPIITEDDPLSDFRIESDGSPDGWGLWIHDDGGSGDPVAAAHFVQHLLAKYWPTESHHISFSCSCSKPRIDEFGGGAIFITGTAMEHLNSWQWAKEQRHPKPTSLELALNKFIDCVKATGGVLRGQNNEVWGCVADPEWLDLADAFLDACKAIGVKPMFKDDGGEQ